MNKSIGRILNRISKKSKAFTIVELLVVIVVIGILAAITIVSYSGITKRAIVSSIQSDLVNAATKMKMFYVDNGVYPLINNCTNTASNEICLNASLNNTYVDHQTSRDSFCVNIVNDGLSFFITDDSGPTEGVCSLIGARFISSGYSNTCAINDNEQTYCWGWNFYGAIGDNSTNDRLTPTAVYTSGVLSSKKVKSVAMSGGSSTCIIASDDKVYCWGFNGSGQLGNNSNTQSTIPVAVYTGGVLNNKTIKFLNANDSSTCAVASDDKVYCWGFNGSGQLGNNSTANSSVPVAVDHSGVLNGKLIKQVSVGSGHACALTSGGLVYCWGSNSYGQLGDNSTTNSLLPVAVDMGGVLNGKTIKSISSRYYYNCAIASDNNAYCWGYGANGQLGNNSISESHVPVAVYTNGVLNGKTIKSITTGEYHACAVASDDKAYCWGYNSDGELGNNSTTRSLVPVAVDIYGVLNNKDIVSISGGYRHTCAISSDGYIYCWGDGGIGQLGDGLGVDSLVPVLTSSIIGKK